MEDFYESKYLESSGALSAEVGNENMSYHNNNSNNNGNPYRNSWRCGAGPGHFFGSLENNIQFVNDITKSPAFHSSFLRHQDSLNPASSLYGGFDPQSTASSSSTQFFTNGPLSSPYANIGLASSSSSLGGYQMESKLFSGISPTNNSQMYQMPGTGLLSRYPNMAAMASFTQGSVAAAANYCLPNHAHAHLLPPGSPPSQVSSVASSQSLSPTHQFSLPHQIQQIQQDQQQQVHNYDPRELEVFSEKFKQRRIKLGVTQADVGKALGNLKLSGVGSLSQSTICRFESLTLSHNNMVALKPILQAWLEEAERQASDRIKNPDLFNDSLDRKRKRTSITDAEKRSLEAYFAVQPRPSSEKISQIADKLNLKKNVVRVWFCNQRQKQKRMKFTTVNMDHHGA